MNFIGMLDGASGAQRSLATWLGLLLGVALLLGSMWLWGRQAGTAACELRVERAATAARKAALDERQRNDRINDAVRDQLQGDLRDARETNDRLTQELADVPRFVSVRRPAAVVAGRSVVAAGLDGVGDQRGAVADGAAVAGAGGAGAAAAPHEAQDLAGTAADAPGAARLSLGAVRLWNSALAGLDVPAGACRADAATSAASAAAACAEPSPASVDDAYANALSNGAAGAECRRRLNAWIDRQIALEREHSESSKR